MFLALLLGGVTITLQPDAIVRGTEIQLASIASIDGADAGEVERVRALKLGYAPAPGYTRTLSAGRLQADVQRLVPGVTVAMQGSGACRVAPAVEHVTAAMIEGAARREVARILPGREFELTLNATILELDVPAGNQPLELRSVLSDTLLRPGPINVPVRIAVDGALYRTVWTNWRLALWEEASVLKRAVEAGETITPELLEKRRVLSSGDGESAPLAIGLAYGAIARQNLAAGQVLREVDLLRELVVKRGDTVFLEVRRGNVHARVAAIAEADAHPGDRIRVKIAETGRAMTATIVSRDLARIELSDRG
jgi:flagella basal body P-ring formation protein FlgA